MEKPWLRAGKIRRFLILFLACSLLLQAPAFASTDLTQTPAARYIALTFDDGPSGAITEALLQVLEKHQVPATFFLCGYRIRQYPQLVGEISQGGHELGIHGYTHEYLNTKTQAQVRDELIQSVSAIAEITGEAPVLFRPPGGLINDAVKKECQDLGFPIVLWSIDPEDWCCTCASTVVSRVVPKAKDGSIILMHDLCRSSVEAADAIISQLKQQGYVFLTVSQLAQAKCSTLEPGERYFKINFVQ